MYKCIYSILCTKIYSICMCVWVIYAFQLCINIKIYSIYLLCTPLLSQNSHLSIEEFHNKLQEATNFPLRPFVIPFLKVIYRKEKGEKNIFVNYLSRHFLIDYEKQKQANLPLLQRELAQCASLAKQTPQQYFARHHHVLLSDGLEGSVVEQLNENGKRPSPDKSKEEAPSTKRHCNSSPTSINLPLGGGPIRLEDISLSRELREREMSQMRERVERERRMGSFSKCRIGV